LVIQIKVNKFVWLARNIPSWSGQNQIGMVVAKVTRVMSEQENFFGIFLELGLLVLLSTSKFVHRSKLNRE
jgi:hypothetical protein